MNDKTNKTKKTALEDLFIEDLGQVTGGVTRAMTTQALGEEDLTTLALGEEDLTTLALGEEDTVTTQALGEE